MSEQSPKSRTTTAAAAAAGTAGGKPPGPPTPARTPPKPPTPAGTAPTAVANTPAPPAPPVTARYRPPRLSITALIGALWAPMFFIMLLLSSVKLDSATSWQRPLQLFIVPLGWAAPFATTVLGLLALGNIQRSNGAQYGLSLALFDALLFPLGLLDFIVFWLCWQLGDAIGAPDMMGAATSSLIFHQAIPTIVCVLGDYYLVTRSWSAVQPRPSAAPAHR